ncbi:MAG: radical SAM family heme chaperone HemW [Pseudomonadota bacterium]
MADAYRAPIDDGAPGFGIYVHWPFCAAKCPYCDFNSHVRHNRPDQARYAAGFEAEIAHMAALQPNTRVTSVFFGGGTPSLMDVGTVDRILRAIESAWPTTPDIEVTLEANPTSVEAGRFRGYRAAGVNRVSLGVQSLRDEDLKFLGRLHSAQEAISAIELARSIFPRLSFDLIYARPDQTEAAWRRELEQAIELAADHLSLYQLTIEPETPFYQLHRAGKFSIPASEQAASLYELTQDVTARHGLHAYEVSNHAKPGAASRHNLTYWRSGVWAGIGPGAHGRLQTNAGRQALVNEKHPETWLKLVEEHGHGVTDKTVLTDVECAEEMLLMGLRLREGIDLSRYTAMPGTVLDQDKLSNLIEDGMMEPTSNGRLRTTPEGALVLNAIIAELASG